MYRHFLEWCAMCAFDTKSLEINARAKSPSRKICQRYRVMQKVIYSDNCVTCISFMELLIFVNIASTHFPGEISTDFVCVDIWYGLISSGSVCLATLSLIYMNTLISLYKWLWKMHVPSSAFIYSYTHHHYVFPIRFGSCRFR